jgi:hypothetical protein
MAFANTSQDWLILQISMDSLRVAHMASHWRINVDADKFNNHYGHFNFPTSSFVAFWPSLVQFMHTLNKHAARAISVIVNLCTFAESSP